MKWALRGEATASVVQPKVTPAESFLEEAGQLHSRPELRNRLKLLERRREGIRKAPNRPRLEFFILRK